MFEELKQMNAELEELKAKHLERSKEMFTKVAGLLFQKHPKLKSFGWNQYTPYFNDGEECVFSANIDEPDINGENGYDINFGDEFVTDYSAKEKDPITKEWPKIKNKSFDLELDAAHADVKEFLSNIDESVLRDLFGDHVEVTVTAEGTETEEHEHD